MVISGVVKIPVVVIGNFTVIVVVAIVVSDDSDVTICDCDFEAVVVGGGDFEVAGVILGD